MDTNVNATPLGQLPYPSWEPLIAPKRALSLSDSLVASCSLAPSAQVETARLKESDLLLESDIK